MKFVFSMTLALALLASAPALAEDIDVMTQNQYLGANLNDIINAPDLPAFNEAVLVALGQIADNDFPARATQLAELIAGRLPDLVGLQEVFAFACFPIAPPFTGCDDFAGAFNDHLPLTLAALEALGESYTVAAIVENLDIQIPADTDGNGTFDILVTVLDRDVILAEADVTNVMPVDYSAFCPMRESVDGCNYFIVAVADTALGEIRQERGWVGVDATIDGKDYRFVNTHLEVQRPDGSVQSSLIQAFQAAELIGVLGASTPPNKSLIVVGDINSSSEDPIIPGPWPPPFDQSGIIPPYTQFVGSGYTDAWDGAPDDLPGFSCCQDDDLLNHQSDLVERIDVIFSIEVWNKVKKARVLGAKVSDKTAPPDEGGLWPSDHGSVAAELQF